MGLFSILLLAIALSFDTFAVALSIGMCTQEISSFVKYRYFTIIGLFHVVMSLIGWSVGASIHSFFSAYDHWIAFVLLTIVGGKMISESLGSKDSDSENDPCRYMNLRNSFVLGFALSIDAIVSGFTFAMINITILSAQSQLINATIASLLIGVVAFFATHLGFKLGAKTGAKLGSKAEIFGGIILIGLGLKTLLGHLLDIG